MIYHASTLLSLICEKVKAKRSYEFETMHESQLNELSKSEFEKDLPQHAVRSSEYEFFKPEFKDFWPFDETWAISIQTCKAQATSSTGIAFITAKLNNGQTKFFKCMMTLNQLITLLLKTDAQWFDARLCQNLFGNDQQKLLTESNSYGFECNLNHDIEQFLNTEQQFKNPANMLSIQRQHFSKGQLAVIDGYHFFVSHASRAQQITSRILADGIGNIVGYIYPDEQQTSRFNGISVITDKNYIVVYSNQLTDMNGEPLPPTWKIFDIFVLSVCQVVNKYSRIDKHMNPKMVGKIPRSAIETAIRDEQTGLAFA